MLGSHAVALGGIVSNEFAVTYIMVMLGMITVIVVTCDAVVPGVVVVVVAVVVAVDTGR
jgi:hypothetical protein